VSKSKKRYLNLWREILAIIVVLASMYYGYWLLSVSLITSSDFLTWNIITWLLAIAFIALPRISEISIGGNVIKLIQATKQAQSTLKGLFRAQLVMLRQTPSGFRSSLVTVDPRVEPFFDLCEEIAKLELADELSADMVQTAQELIQTHVTNFMDMLFMHEPPKDEFYSDDELIQHRVMPDAKDVYVRLRDFICR